MAHCELNTTCWLKVELRVALGKLGGALGPQGFSDTNMLISACVGGLVHCIGVLDQCVWGLDQCAGDLDQCEALTQKNLRYGGI